MMPEHRPKWVVDAIRSKTDVLYPGCRIPAQDQPLPKIDRTRAPLIIWNHRWEFDKNPDDFFDALDAVASQGADFHLALLGESCQTVPKVFMRARKRYGRRILQYGHVASRAAYVDWLKQGAITISTAQQENFGISVVEAVRFGCYPLLPKRLAYPEVIPENFHPHVLYQDQEDLIARLQCLLSRFEDHHVLRCQLAEAMGGYAWEAMIDRYDALLESLAQMKAQHAAACPPITR
jgi:glycosyltransferase involved in cell wall biosynthesis